MGNPRSITADVLDLSSSGIGVSVAIPLFPGAKVFLRGGLGPDGANATLQATVKWCVEAPEGGSFRAGLEFTESGSAFEHSATADPAEIDCYEILQVSPNADSETIGRVYRMLAQRYHPDNTATGNSETFLKVVQAYRILSDDVGRAKYDARHRQKKQLHWKIFDSATSAAGPEAEKRKRQGILGLLYAKAIHDPDRAAMNVLEFESLLGCPREHLQAALWYLRGKSFIQRADNGRYTITVQGFDEVERNRPAQESSDIRLLPSKAMDR